MTEGRIRSLSCWKGAVSLEPIAGGISNVNYRVRDIDATYVARCCEDKHEVGVDRRSERVCQEAAFRAGVAPKIVHQADGILVSRYIDAEPLSVERLQDPTLLTRLASRVCQLHNARNDLVGEMLYFCPFQSVRTYAANARRLNATMPDNIDTYLEECQQLSLEMTAFHPTLCHNDLLPANIIDDSQTLWFVDWEYAGVGNPLFDLASISSNAQLSDELEAVLLEAYLGNDDELRRQVRILKTVSLLREALWSVIQSVTSTIDFDYDNYTATNLAAYRQARSKLDLGRA